MTIAAATRTIGNPAYRFAASSIRASLGPTAAQHLTHRILDRPAEYLEDRSLSIHPPNIGELVISFHFSPLTGVLHCNTQRCFVGTGHSQSVRISRRKVFFGSLSNIRDRSGL